MTDVDSVRVVHEDRVNRIHSHKPPGRLHKGHNVIAATASIPSKYQTIVVDNAEKRGFLSKSKRFQHESESNDHPGPGTYKGAGHSNIEGMSPSFSKKGTGGFASKDRRILKNVTAAGPGAGVYALPSLLTTRKEYNKAACTSVFHKPIAQVTDKNCDKPAPNQYDTLGVKFGKTNNVTAAAAFKSKSQREVINVGDARNKPAPWQYHVQDELVKGSVQVPYSSFKSKTTRRMQADPAPNPGPGTYHPHEEAFPVNKTVFPRKHYLCISAPAMPLPQTPPPPGPGSYELVNYEGPEKHYMSSAMFVSTSGRWNGQKNLMADIPGPAHYRPAEVNKQSFIYNSAARWI